MSKKTIVISSGDPAGVGPWVSVEALAKIVPCRRADFVLVGDERILRRAPAYRKIRGKITVVGLKNAGGIKPGRIGRRSGEAALQYLDTALAFVRRQAGAALVTAPVSKEAISLVRKFSGHTEFLAQACGCREVLMMMVGKKLRVALLSRHLHLRRVSSFLCRHDLCPSLELVVFALQRLFRLASPRLGVCSFNPHAGRDTFQEKEELSLMACLRRVRKRGAEFIGPYPADVVFRRALAENWDCVVSLYHDQAMIPFRLLEFSCGVNLTVGLPFIRTSPAHGVAREAAKQPQTIDCRPMEAAIRLCLKLAGG